MKTVHIFHHNDLDGRVSGALMYEYFKKYVKDVNNYEWNKDNVNKERAQKWIKFSKKKREEYKGRIKKWKTLDTIE